MPATEETFRSQPYLHIVFAVSSVAMMLVIIWMILADHLRPWKKVQREFHRIETAKLAAQRQKTQEEEAARNRDARAEIERKIDAADKLATANASRIRDQEDKIRTIRGRYEKLDTDRRFQKAELDSQRSFYDGKIDLGLYAEARDYLKTTIAASEAKLRTITAQFERAKADLAREEAVLADLRGHKDELIKERDRLDREIARANRILEQKEAQYFGPLAWLRSLPGIDLAAPPTKIQQISLPELTINYNFKDVPRYDRCTTCHLGIDKIGFETTADGRPMPAVFASHPSLTSGATSRDPSGKLVHAGLYLDGNGPHGINTFGCTICHGGQGSGTDFTYASHEPSDLEERQRWERQHHWHEIHHWDEPMLPSRFLQASCLKCHHQVTDIPQAQKVQAGYDRIVTYGCTGCHTIGGEGAFGPDLTDARQVGPNLAHIGSKVSPEWALKWIKNPHAFRPDTRMPRFYDVTNNSDGADQPKVYAEVHAITHYLFAKSTPPPGFVAPAEPGRSGPDRLPNQADTDVVRGKETFLQKGCMACHSHRPYTAADLPASLAAPRLNPQYQPDPSQTMDPAQFPESARRYAAADFGPNLSNIAAKFQTGAQGYQWLANWIKSPEAYHPKSLMPNLQLSWQEAADIASWILSVPGQWPLEVEVPASNSSQVVAGIDELVRLYKVKSGTPLSQLDEVVQAMSPEDKLMYLGERTIGRLGCFGCHNIPGFEKYKPIGTPLNGWGFKSPTKLDFAHITEYLDDHSQLIEDGERVKRVYDGTDEYYHEKLQEHTRIGFLFQKLHRPRSYDYKKTREELKTWDDRLRMPQFTWADDLKAIEEVMTFVLGLTGEKIGSKYLPNYRPETLAIAQGQRLLDRYNCRGCHVLAMPQYTIPAGTKVAEALPNFQTNVESSFGAQGRGSDHLTPGTNRLAFYPALSYDPDATPTLTPDDGKTPVVIEGMPNGLYEEQDDQGNIIIQELTVQLWQPVTIRGYTFNVGDNLILDPRKVRTTDPDGGNFAWLYAAYEAQRTGGTFADVWNRLPPPLVREGRKVQTPWLTRFLKDPYPIRPATILRMPQFHYGSAAAPTPEAQTALAPEQLAELQRTAHAAVQEETKALANYFAAVNGAEFPYQDIPQRERNYLAGRLSDHPDYLDAGWRMMGVQGSACIQCHAVGASKPAGGAKVVNGPDLRQVADRFRPDYLAEWLARPMRLIPYTAMPQNIPPHGTPAVPLPLPKTFEDRPLEIVLAIRDTLLNYVTAVEGQLAGTKGQPAPAEAEKAPAEAVKAPGEAD